MHKINLEKTKLITNIVNTLITNDMTTNQNTLIAHLRNAETNHIGFSYNINNGDSNPDKGYMVSIKGHEEIAYRGSDIVAFGRHYFLRHSETLAEGNAYMGCWVDGDRFVFDISENIQFLEVAIELGSINNQQAIWDCASGSEYRLMREGDDEPEEEDIFVNINQGLGLPTKEEGINAYSTEDFDAMLHTLGVAMDELNELHNHSRTDDYYEIHMNQLDNIINLINKLR